MLYVETDRKLTAAIPCFALGELRRNKITSGSFFQRHQCLLLCDIYNGGVMFSCSVNYIYFSQTVASWVIKVGRAGCCSFSTDTENYLDRFTVVANFHQRRV